MMPNAVRVTIEILNLKWLYPLLEACCRHDRATDHESLVANEGENNRKQSARQDI
jgi:hypothetical protein